MTKKVISEDYATRMKDPSLTWYEKLYGRTEEDIRARLIHAMHEHNVWRIEAAYSGGHDEGGVDDLLLKDSDGEPMSYASTKGDDFWSLCNEVLSTKFLSWALGMSVAGALIVDRGEGRLWTEGQHEDWVNDDDPIDWKL